MFNLMAARLLEVSREPVKMATISPSTCRLGQRNTNFSHISAGLTLLNTDNNPEVACPWIPAEYLLDRSEFGR